MKPAERPTRKPTLLSNAGACRRAVPSMRTHRFRGPGHVVQSLLPENSADLICLG
jgi:hypothetical protein